MLTGSWSSGVKRFTSFRIIFSSIFLRPPELSYEAIHPVEDFPHLRTVDISVWHFWRERKRSFSVDEQEASKKMGLERMKRFHLAEEATMRGRRLRKWENAGTVGETS